MVLPGLGSKCAPGLFCASDLAGSEHQILLPAVVPGGSPNRGTNNHLHCHHFSLPEFLVLGMCRRQGRVSLCWSSPEAAPCPPTHSLSCPRPWGTQGQELFPWTGLREAAVPTNGVGGSPASTQRSGVLQTMAAPAPHTSLSKEPCF